MRWVAGRSRIARAVVASLVSIGCGDTADPCVSSGGPEPDAPVACAGGADPTILSKVSAPSAELDTEIASSHRRIVLDADYAYWSDYAGRVLRTPKKGGAMEVLLEASDCSIADLAVDDVGVYFGQNCPVPGGPSAFPVEGKIAWLGKADGSRHDIASELGVDVQQIAIGGGTLYWVISDEAAAAYLRSAPRDLAEPIAPGAPYSALVSVESVWMNFALAGDGIVWVNHATGEIRRSGINGGASDVLASAPDVESLFVVGVSAYWVENARQPSHSMARHLWRVPTAGGRTERVFDGIVTEHVVTDGTDFYGAGFDTEDGAVVNRIYAWRAPAHEPETLAAGIEWPQSLAMDDTDLFFLDRSMGDPFELRLIRVAKR